jgi:hypothetical protein
MQMSHRSDQGLEHLFPPAQLMCHASLLLRRELHFELSLGLDHPGLCSHPGAACGCIFLMENPQRKPVIMNEHENEQG